MIRKIEKPSTIEAAGTGAKIIREYFGRVNSKTEEISIARMDSPQGWEEPGQCPEFNEYTLVLRGKLRISSKTEDLTVIEGEAVLTPAGEWVKYSTPFEGGAEYIAICLPAFSPAIVHRDE